MYTAFERGWRGPDNALDHQVVALLPSELREREGRRHLGLPALEAHPEQRLQYVSFLPWEEAQEVLRPFLRKPDADLRVAAHRALIYAARYHRDRLPELLTLIRSRQHEQDPVRYAILAGLSDLPPGVWRKGHLEDLGRIVRDALDASDLSPATAAAAEQSVVAVFPFHSEWSIGWLATLVRERGHISLSGLEHRLTDADVLRLAPALLPVLEGWMTRVRVPQLVGIAHALGKRLRVFEGLVELLELVLSDTRSSTTANQILSLLREHRPDRLAQVVPSLIREDQSSIVLPEVSEYLHRRRQDLLTPFLGREAYRGRFATGRTRYVLPCASGFHRWTAAQQEAFAQTLREVTHDSVRDSPAIFRAISQLAALPDVEPRRLVQLAEVRNTRLALRDAALRALGQLDAGQGVEPLLDALSDDRGRVAIYALRGALLEMPAERAMELLRGVPMERVTVAKEVVRLLGELDSEQAYRELLLLDGRELHRDVRVALLRAFWGHAERAETWPSLERAAASPDAAVA
ncbi:MAG: hypothetical protein M3P51_13450, partial [Chloroflexota bacterium]|nr:hypothetical protein [Chloroflexota bacterium]